MNREELSEEFINRKLQEALDLAMEIMEEKEMELYVAKIINKHLALHVAKPASLNALSKDEIREHLVAIGQNDWQIVWDIIGDLLPPPESDE